MSTRCRKHTPWALSLALEPESTCTPRRPTRMRCSLQSTVRTSPRSENLLSRRRTMPRQTCSGTWTSAPPSSFIIASRSHEDTALSILPAMTSVVSHCIARHATATISMPLVSTLPCAPGINAPVRPWYQPTLPCAPRVNAPVRPWYDCLCLCSLPAFGF